MVDQSNPFGWLPGLYDPFRATGERRGELFAPAAEASTDEAGYHITMELPGVAEDDLEVSVHEGIVTVTGEKKSEREEKGKSFYFSERSFGSFRRSFRLPDDAKQDEIDAHFEDGVLKLTAPRALPKPPEARKIAVKRPEKTGEKTG